MENLEKVEKLRERANVSYEEAKEALEKCGWDILDAMIYLEQNGKAQETKGASYSTHYERVTGETVNSNSNNCNNFTDGMKRFGKWLKMLIVKGNTNSFVVEKDGIEVFRVPVTVLVLLLFFAFWGVLPLLIVGLFFNMRYHFAGPDIHSVDIDINKAMDSASKAAEDIKNEFANAVSKESTQNTEK